METQAGYNSNCVLYPLRHHRANIHHEVNVYLHSVTLVGANSANSLEPSIVMAFPWVYGVSLREAGVWLGVTW